MLFAPTAEQRPADARGQRAALHRGGTTGAEGAVATHREEWLGDHLLGTVTKNQWEMSYTVVGILSMDWFKGKFTRKPHI